MPEGGNEFLRKLIEQVDAVDQIPQMEPKDPDREVVESALHEWIAARFPQGFDLDPERVDLTVEIYKAVEEIKIASPFFVYIDALLGNTIPPADNPILPLRRACVLGMAIVKVLYIDHPLEEERPPEEE